MLTATYIRGAYGRKYKTLIEANKDWIEGKDFRTLKGQYCSIRDFTLLDTVYVLDYDGNMIGKIN
jgi:hypothetical protein